MKESIQKLDLNFTNGGGGHTANVSSILDAKSLDGSEGLGIVVGELGEINSFSNDRISDIMSNFICTSHSVGADPTKKVVSRKYTDRTSLLLKSYVVLVRGKDCGPETLNFEGAFPYFTEVLGSPLRPFKAKPPVVDRSNSIIMIGKIYNSEAAARFDGVKISLVYQNKELKTKLSLNDEAVSATYKGSPDLAKYDLKFGYTIRELREALGQVGVVINGLPNNEDILFENSGSLDSVIGSVASYLGYFWFVNPETGTIEFINTAQASSIRLTDYTNSEDENIINASFTRSTISKKLVNIYKGSQEKPEKNTDDGNDRVRRIFFKRIYPERLEAFPLSHKVVGAFFAIFNQNMGADTFDKFAYILLNMNKDRPNGKSPAERIFGEKLDFKDLYTDEPKTHKLWKYHKGSNELDTIVPIKDIAKEKAMREPILDRVELDRFSNKFLYFNLSKKPDENFVGPPNSGGQAMMRPSQSELYAFLSAYYSLAGGFFISNGYSQYKAERVQWQNSGNMTILGPYHKDDNIRDIDDLSDFNDFLDIIDVERPTVGDLAEGTNGEAKNVHDFHFIAIRNIKQRERFKDDDFVDMKTIEHFMEIWSQVPNLNYSFLGGPSVIFEKGKLEDVVIGIVEQSYKNFLNTYDGEKKTVGCKYVRSQTRVNKQEDDEDDEQEDDDIAESDDNSQALSDLFDRFDLKSYEIKGPSHNILNNITLSNYSGSVTEMEALKKERVNYDNSIDIPESSSRTIYGLKIPNINATTNSISISVGSNGIQTTINESTIKLLPPDQQFLTNQGMDISNKSMVPASFSATQRNFFGL